jgi:hypothetical protein
MAITPIAIALAVGAVAQMTGGSVGLPYTARPLLRLRGEGEVIYQCRSRPSDRDAEKGPGYYFWWPSDGDAQLFDSAGQLAGTYRQDGIWKLNDGSQVEAEPEAVREFTDQEPGGTAWAVMKAKPGSATGKLAAAAWIRETYTHGGGRPDKNACLGASDAKKTARVSYRAIYTLYAAQ